MPEPRNTAPGPEAGQEGLRLKPGDLPTGRATEIDLEPPARWRADLAEHLAITGIRKLRLTGTLVPEGGGDWRLSARLGATVVQPCVVTLAPVTSRIEEEVSRLYLADMPEQPAGAEVEMPEDVSLEPLGSVIDLGVVIAEELALALPPYPRAEGVAFEGRIAAAPGVAPMSDDDAKPFAGLKGLRDKLTDED